MRVKGDKGGERRWRRCRLCGRMYIYAYIVRCILLLTSSRFSLSFSRPSLLSPNALLSHTIIYILFVIKRIQRGDSIIDVTSDIDQTRGRRAPKKYSILRLCARPNYDLIDRLN